MISATLNLHSAYEAISRSTFCFRHLMLRPAKHRPTLQPPDSFCSTIPLLTLLLQQPAIGPLSTAEPGRLTLRHRGLFAVQHRNYGGVETPPSRKAPMIALGLDMNGATVLEQVDGASNRPIRGVISDLDGVAYRDETPIASSVQAFRAWRERGVPYAFVTNNSTKSAGQFAAKLAGMGIPATAPQVFSTISAVQGLLRQQCVPGTRVFAIGEKPLLETLEDAGYRLTGTDAEVVVLGFDSELSYAKLRIAVRAALAGATVIATNPDVLTPVHDGYDPCVGVLIAAVTAAVPTAAPIIVGKPHPFMIEQALSYIGTQKDETVMIGDQVATDIIAGQSAGLRSILLTSDVPFNAIVGVTPDRIVSSLLDLVEVALEADVS